MGDSEVEALQEQLEGVAVDVASLRGELQQAVADGVADGLRAVMQDPEAIAALMDAVVTTAQQRAAQQAGQALFGVIRTVLGKWLVIAAIVLLAFKLAGADVAGKVWKLMTGGTP